MEKDIEGYLRTEMRKVGGLALKFVCPNMRGVPDRICIFPSGIVVFVELKDTGKKVPIHQQRMHKYMREAGAKVVIIDSKVQVQKFIGEHNV